MAERFLFLSIFVITIFSYANGVETVGGRIKLTIGTSSGCPVARNVVTNHLAPTFEQYKAFLDVEFVPWGRTERQPNGTLTCQFGVNDCWANRLHRCVLNHHRDNLQAQVDYMTCEFTHLAAFGQRNFRCAIEAGMRLVDVDHCVNNPGQDTLDEDAAAAAADPMAIINRVGFVVFNDDINVENSLQARQRLSSMVCFALAGDPSTGIYGCQI